MDIRILMIHIAYVFLVSAQDSIYKLKHICPPQLSITLRRYNCVYYEPAVTSSPVPSNGGIVAECCRNMCSEYYLVTTYCKRSTIVVTERSDLLNQIIKETTNLNEIKQSGEEEEEEEVTESIHNNALTKESTKQERIYKPAVIVLSKISENVPIPVQRRY